MALPRHLRARLVSLTCVGALSVSAAMGLWYVMPGRGLAQIVPCANWLVAAASTTAALMATRAAMPHRSAERREPSDLAMIVTRDTKSISMRASSKRRLGSVRFLAPMNDAGPP